MAPARYMKKILERGIQLTVEAKRILDSIDNPEYIIDNIINSDFSSPIISAEDISKFLKEKNKKQKVNQTAKSKSIEHKDIKKSSEIIKNKAIKGDDNKQELARIRQDKYSKDIEILSSPKIEALQTNEEGFRQYFVSRYQKISQIFLKRRDITNVRTCEELGSSSRKEDVSVIGIVFSKTITKKGSVILELEDLTGGIKAIVPSTNKTLLQKAQFILNDTVLYFSGSWQNEVLYIKDIQWPDVPFSHKPNHSYEDVMALFISDLHVGSKKFSSKLFSKVIDFVNGNVESDKYNRFGRKVKYIFIAGDVVDGVGVYPEQIKDLMLDNIQFQYLLATEYIEKIRSDVEIIIIPGNHDSARAAEPQTPIPKQFIEELYKLDNVHILGSPSYLRVHGVEILINHGNSIFDISAAITPIPHSNTIMPMVEMLRNRHLVPIYGAKTAIAPANEDYLVIERVPDIFHVGHTHIAEDDTYNGVTLISSGSFQYQTDYQKRMDINPSTGIAYLVNLQTLVRSRIDFSTIIS